MENYKIKKAADILYNSRINLKRIKELPKECIPKSLEEAYAIQDELTKRYLSTNQKTSLIGKKIGCTNKAAQIQINVKESFFGNMFSDNISKSNSIIYSDKYFNPFVEPEFSFVMKNELDFSKAPYNADEVYKFISAVLPSIELVDSRYEDWTSIGVNNLIADNAVHAHWVFGTEISNLNLFNFNNHSVDFLLMKS
jgi:2-keto-4-pentenoate hydratase